jgi:hypothetical protein
MIKVDVKIKNNKYLDMEEVPSILALSTSFIKIFHFCRKDKAS